MSESNNNVTISFGPGNSIRKPISHTSEITNAWIEALGADPGRVEFFVNGERYSGPLSEGDTVELKTKANEKGC